MELFVPDAAYVERLAERADAALELVESVWRDGVPIDVRDRAALFHTARHVAYGTRTTVPDDEEMTLFQTLVAGLGDQYGLPAWRARQPRNRIMQSVRFAWDAEAGCSPIRRSAPGERPAVLARSVREGEPAQALRLPASGVHRTARGAVSG